MTPDATFVAGAIDETSTATGVNGDQSTGFASTGAAYIFHRTGTTWTQQAYVKASNTDANDAFGISVAVSGDTVVVGAQREDGATTGLNGDDTDNTANGAGAAYWFVRTDTTWTQQAYVKASNTDAVDLFGTAVAASGDTFAVSAQFEDSNATGVNGDESDNSSSNSGAVYVFRP